MKKEKSKFTIWWEEFYDDAKRWWSDVRYAPIGFWKSLCRSTSWFVFMWNNYDWDYNFLYKVIYKKLSAIEKSLRVNGNHVTSKSDAKIIRIALWYLERLIKDDMTDSLQDKVEAKYGRLRMVEDTERDTEHPNLTAVKFIHADDPAKDEHASKLRTRVYMYHEYLTRKYLDKFCAIIAKHSQRWWD
jgi:hypothetical protein